MQMVRLGTISLNGAAGVVAMRRKLLTVAERLGFSAGRSARLAAAASDYAKTVVRHEALKLRLVLMREGATQELCADFLDASDAPGKFLDLGFDRYLRHRAAGRDPPQRRSAAARADLDQFLQ